jgi:hypothetical protein
MRLIIDDKVYRMKTNLQGAELGLKGTVWFDAIPLGFSLFKTSKSWTAYIYFLLWCFEVTGGSDL